VGSLTSHNPIGLQGLLRDSFTFTFYPGGYSSPFCPYFTAQGQCHLYLYLVFVCSCRSLLIYSGPYSNECSLRRSELAWKQDRTRLDTTGVTHSPALTLIAISSECDGDSHPFSRLMISDLGSLLQQRTCTKVNIHLGMTFRYLHGTWLEHGQSYSTFFENEMYPETARFVTACWSIDCCSLFLPRHSAYPDAISSSI
jgi:hypothetical protein